MASSHIDSHQYTAPPRVGCGTARFPRPSSAVATAEGTAPCRPARDPALRDRPPGQVIWKEGRSFHVGTDGELEEAKR
jgi:hypothetical protein